MSRRTIGSLTQADLGKLLRLDNKSGGSCVLLAVQHVSAFGDIEYPWTRLTVTHNGVRMETSCWEPSKRVEVKAPFTDEEQLEHLAHVDREVARSSKRLDQFIAERRDSP